MVLGRVPAVNYRLPPRGTTAPRHRIPLPLDRQLEQPGMVVRAKSLCSSPRLQKSAGSRPTIGRLSTPYRKHAIATSRPCLLMLGVCERIRRHAEITPPDLSWLARRRNDHVTVAIQSIVTEPSIRV